MPQNYGKSIIILKLQMALQCDITNLPNSFVSSCDNLHALNCTACQWANEEHINGFDARFLSDVIPWMKNNNTPPCVWAIGWDLYEICTRTKENCNKEHWVREAEQFTALRAFWNELSWQTLTLIESTKMRDEAMKLDCLVWVRRHQFPLDKGTAETTLALIQERLKYWNIFDTSELTLVFYLQAMDFADYIIHSNKQLKERIANLSGPSIEEVIKQFNSEKGKGNQSRKIKLKPKLKGKAKARIVRAKLNRTTKQTKAEDNESINSNKYHKRFTKTKKPARL